MRGHLITKMNPDKDIDLFSLGKLYPSDFLKEGELPRCAPIELKLVMDANGIVKLANNAPQEVCWGKYWYRSSTNELMQKQLANIVDSIMDTYQMPVSGNSIWLDIASNDGYLLSCIPPLNIMRIGIDPAEDNFKEECERHADLVIQDYFSAKVFKEYMGESKATIITAISMFYDLDDPDKFLSDVYDILDNNGLFVLQLSYTPLMIKQLAFDNICHEHRRYYSLFNIKKLLENNGFQLLDCQLNETNSGSFRIYAMKKFTDITKFGSIFCRMIGEYRIKMMLEYEKKIEIDTPKIWRDFYENILTLKEKTLSFIKNEKANGKVIMGYGASTKGATLMQFFGLDNTLITAIADRSQYKTGLRTVGTNIPIISEDEMRREQPDYLLILPYHFIDTFIKREKEYLRRGGKFIVPCPKFSIYAE